MTLIIYNVSGCSSIEIVHDPVSCVGQPSITMGITADEFKAAYDSDDEDINKLQQSALNKAVVLIKKLRARIDTQCKINLLHDKLHGGNK